MEEEYYTITKRIAKQGINSVIVIPSVLRERLKPSTLVRIRIDVINESD